MWKSIALIILVYSLAVNASWSPNATCECASEELVRRAVTTLVNAAVFQLEHFQTQHEQELVSTHGTEATCEVTRCVVTRSPATRNCASRQFVANEVASAVNAAVGKLQRTFRRDAEALQTMVRGQNRVIGCYDSGYKYFPELEVCYKLHDENVDWPQANRSCVAEGAHLAVPNSSEEMGLIKKIVAEPRVPKWGDALMWAYVGVYRDLEGEWMTVTGETLNKTLGYNAWRSTFPSDREQRGMYVAVFEGKFVNMPTGWGNFFICEKELQ